MYTKIKDAVSDFNVVNQSKVPEDIDDLFYKKDRFIAVPLSDEQRGELLAMTGRPA